MLFEEMMRDEYKAGKVAGIAEGEENYLTTIVHRKKVQGYTIEEIAAFLEEDIKKITAIYS